MGSFAKETELQTKMVQWLRATHPESLVWHCPNEACARRWNFYQNQGVLKGAPDLTIILPGVVFFVECKTGRGRQTPEQKVFGEKCASLGIGYYVCRSLEQFVDIVESYLA